MWAAQFVAECKSEREAHATAAHLRTLEECLGARGVGDGRSKPWGAAYYFDDSPAVTALEGARRVWLTPAILRELGR
jgi:hypothetical protein